MGTERVKRGMKRSTSLTAPSRSISVAMSPSSSHLGSDFGNEKQLRGGLVFKARRLVVSLNSRPRVIKNKKREGR